MEGVEEEMVASNNIQIKGPEDNLLYKLDGQLPMESQNMNNNALGGDCLASSLQRNVDTIECKDLSICVVSVAGSGPPFNTCYSMDDPNIGVSVEELTVGNYRNPGLILGSDMGSSRASGSGFRAAAGECNGSQPQDMDQILVKIRQQLARAPSERQNLETFLCKRSDQSLEAVSARLRATDDKNISNAPALAGGAAQLRTPFTSSSFSQLILKRALKGKAIVGRNQDAHSEFDSDQYMGCKEERLNSKPPSTHHTLIHKSSSKNEMVDSHKADTSSPKSSLRGISLREFLKPGYPRRDKVKNLLLFRQIVELVHTAHSQGIVLQDMSPSFFTVSPSYKLRYVGFFGKKDLDTFVNEDTNKKRCFVQEPSTLSRDLKQPKLDLDVRSPGSPVQFVSTSKALKKTSSAINLSKPDSQNTNFCELPYKNNFNYPAIYFAARKQSMSTALKLEEQWYTSPEELNGGDRVFKSNIYALGVLLFELLCNCDSDGMNSAVMSDLRHRILPPRFLSNNPKEAGFCLLLMHPEPSYRPTAREILQSELICEDNSAISTTADEESSGLLLHFLGSLEEQKHKHVSKLIQDIQTIEDDIKEAERRYSSDTSLTSSSGANERRGQPCLEGPTSTSSSACLMPNANTDRLMKNIGQLEDAYFFMRSRMNLSDSSTAARSEKSLLKNKDRRPDIQNENKDTRTKGRSSDQHEVFFEGLCKFARYSKFETLGTIRSGDLLNSANVICSMSLDPDEEHFAAAGISKRIKIFDFDAFLNESISVHYPVVEMCNKSKISCVCWNSYIKNYLASTDYDGAVQIWDAGTGQGFSQYVEHQKRAWSVDFSSSDPTKFVSGSDDCSVRLWSINEKKSVGTIWSPANVCCVQFSSSSNHLLSFGSADYKVYCYDLRHVRTPWCTLAGHERAVSYVKFMDSDTIVSASTDNCLKIWNLNKTSSSGLSSGACTLTFKGHTNKKNFVGLSVLDGYIACGSETNEVYSYYQSFPMPITSYKFGTFDPISGNEFEDDHGQFVSSVCWRRKSSMLIAANSTGSMKLLKLV